MRIKLLLYLSVILVSVVDAVIRFLNEFQIGTWQGFQILEKFDFIGVGLIVFGVMLLKLSFEISLKFEVFLLVTGLGTNLWLHTQAPNQISQFHAEMAFIIFPLFAVLFYIEFIKELLLTDLVMTVRGILIKAVSAATIIYVLLELAKVYQVAIDFSLKPMQLTRLTVVVVLFAMLIYLYKLGFSRSTRQLEEQGYFIDDLRKMFKFKIRNVDLMLYALYGMMIFSFLANKLDFYYMYPLMVGGIFFAARGYKNWMFAFVFMSTLGALSYYTRTVGTVDRISDYMLESGFTYLVILALGIVLPYIFDLINRFGVATFSNSSEQ